MFKDIIYNFMASPSDAWEIFTGYMMRVPNYQIYDESLKDFFYT